jgi:hypothetical protein
MVMKRALIAEVTEHIIQHPLDYWHQLLNWRSLK